MAETGDVPLSEKIRSLGIKLLPPGGEKDAPLESAPTPEISIAEKIKSLNIVGQPQAVLETQPIASGPGIKPPEPLSFADKIKTLNIGSADTSAAEKAKPAPATPGGLKPSTISQGKEITMSQGAPDIFKARPLQEIPSDFSQSLSAAAFALRSGFPMPAVSVQGVHDVISSASQEMAVDSSPEVADFIAKQKIDGGSFKSPFTGDIVQRPSTVGEALESISAAAQTKDPLLSALKSKMASVRLVRPDQFGRQEQFKGFLDQYNQILREDAQSAVRSASDFVPEDAIELGGAAINVYALVEAVGAARAFSLAVSHGIRGEALGDFVKSISAAGKAISENSPQNIAIKTDAIISKPIEAAKRYLGDSKSFFRRYGRVPSATDSDLLAATRQPSLAGNEIEHVAYLAARERSYEHLSKAEVAAAKKDLARMSSKGKSFPIESIGPIEKGETAPILAKPRAITETKLPEVYLPSLGPAGNNIFTMVKNKGFDKTQLSANALSIAQSAFKGLSEAESMALRILGDPTARMNLLKDLPATISPVESVAETMNKLLRVLPQKSRQRVLDAHEKLTSGMQVVTSAAKSLDADNAVGFSFKDKFDDFTFNKYNYFGHFYQTPAAKIQDMIVKGERTLLESTEDFAYKKATLSPDVYGLALEKSARDAAEDTMRSFRRGSTVFPEKGWEASRRGIAGYSEDLEGSYVETINAYAERIARIDRFGPGDQYLRKQADNLDRLNPKGYDKGFVDEYIRLHTDGEPPRAGHSLFKAIAGWDYLTKLGHAQISNAFEFLSKAPARIGFKKTLQIVGSSAGRGMIDALESGGFFETRKVMQDFIKVYGVDELEAFRNAVVRGTGRKAMADSLGIPEAEFAGEKIFSKMISVEDGMRAIGLTRVTDINKKWFMEAGRFYADMQARVLKQSKPGTSAAMVARAKLKDLGISDEGLSQATRRGNLPEFDLQRAEIVFMESEAAIPTSARLPLLMHDPGWQLIMRFKGPAIMQTANQYKQLFGTAAGSASERAATLAKLLAAGSAAGISSSMIKDFLRGKPAEDFSAGKIANAENAGDFVRNYFSVLGAGNTLGAMESLSSLLVSGQRSRGASPFLGDLSEASDAIGQAQKGDMAPLARLSIKRGMPIAAALLGKPKMFAAAAVGSQAVANTLLPKEGETPLIAELPLAAAAIAIGGASKALGKKRPESTKIKIEPQNRKFSIPGPR